MLFSLSEDVRICPSYRVSHPLRICTRARVPAAYLLIVMCDNWIKNAEQVPYLLWSLYSVIPLQL